MTKKEWIRVLTPICLVVLFFLIFGISPIFPSKKIIPIIKAESQRIKLIKLTPFRNIKLKNNLVTKLVKIKEKDVIKLICQSINEAYEYTPVHPKSIWNCVLSVVRDDGEYTCLISKTEKGEVLIQIKSRGEWGWRLGDYRSDRTGTILENYLKEKR